MMNVCLAAIFAGAQGMETGSEMEQPVQSGAGGTKTRSIKLSHRIVVTAMTSSASE